jgi:Uma2 family endonuclease
MVIQAKRYTVDEFAALVNSPENADRVLEYIGGEVVVVPSNPYSSKIATRISGFIFAYLLQNDIGHLTGEAGGYVVAGERYAPDVAFISYAKQQELAREGYNPNPPDLAVEVISPTDVEHHLRIKVVNYQAVGTVVWVVNPQANIIEVYRPGQPVTIAEVGDTLDGGDFLPGFTLPVKDIFPAVGPAKMQSP